MRWFFYLLVLANAGYLIWNVVSPVPDAVQPSVTVAGDRTIVMLTEAPSRTELEIRDDTEGTANNQDVVQVDGSSIVEDTPSLVAPVGQEELSAEQPITMTEQCLRLSNITTVNEQNALADELGALGIEILDKGSEPATKSNHWVLLPPAKSRTEAKETLAKLKSKGIKDYYLVGDGENENAISLGVFSRPESAQRRVVQIRNTKLGLKPVIEAVVLPTTRYWLMLHVVNGGESALEDVVQKRVELKLLPISCEK